MLRNMALAVIAAVGMTHAEITEEFVGRGQILAMNSSSVMTATPDTYVGCLDASGALTASDCAVFTRNDDEPHYVSTHAGKCSFTDTDMPANEDSIYGQRNHAFSCGPRNTGESIDRLYTIDGLQYPYLCSLAIDCYYDVDHVPRAGERLPVWQYTWGSLQMGITPGHVQLVWMWARVDGD